MLDTSRLDWTKEDSELTAKCKRIAKLRLEGLETEEEVTRLRDEAGDRANRFWRSRQDSLTASTSNYWHDLWEVEDIVWKMLTDCIHESFYKEEINGLRKFLAELDS